MLVFENKQDAFFFFFAGAASEATALQHLRHICWSEGECFASNGSINSAYFGCFPYEAGGRQEGNSRENCRATCFHGLFTFFHCTCPYFPDGKTRKVWGESRKVGMELIIRDPRPWGRHSTDASAPCKLRTVLQAGELGVKCNLKSWPT